MNNDDLTEAIKDAKNALVVLYIKQNKYLEDLEEISKTSADDVEEYIKKSERWLSDEKNAGRSAKNYLDCFDNVHRILRQRRKE